jgi:hypothetical protein
MEKFVLKVKDSEAVNFKCYISDNGSVFIEDVRYPQLIDEWVKVGRSTNKTLDEILNEGWELT